MENTLELTEECSQTDVLEYLKNECSNLLTEYKELHQ